MNFWNSRPTQNYLWVYSDAWLSSKVACFFGDDELHFFHESKQLLMSVTCSTNHNFEKFYKVTLSGVKKSLFLTIFFPKNRCLIKIWQRYKARMLEIQVVPFKPNTASSTMVLNHFLIRPLKLRTGIHVALNHPNWLIVNPKNLKKRFLWYNTVIHFYDLHGPTKPSPRNLWGP